MRRRVPGQWLWCSHKLLRQEREVQKQNLPPLCDTWVTIKEFPRQAVIRSAEDELARGIRTVRHRGWPSRRWNFASMPGSIQRFCYSRPQREARWRVAHALPAVILIPGCGNVDAWVGRGPSPSVSMHVPAAVSPDQCQGDSLATMIDARCHCSLGIRGLIPIDRRHRSLERRRSRLSLRATSGFASSPIRPRSLLRRMSGSIGPATCAIAMKVTGAPMRRGQSGRVLRNV